jgi:hypothetical protein
MVTGAHKTQRMASAFVVLLKRYHRDGDVFLSHIVRVTDDKTWVSFVNVETKEQSKQRMHIYSPNKPNKFKQTSSRKDRTEVLMMVSYKGP